MHRKKTVTPHLSGKRARQAPPDPDKIGGSVLLILVNKKTRYSESLSGNFLCRRRDLNPHEIALTTP